MSGIQGAKSLSQTDIEFAPGDLIGGKYIVEKRLGRGGYGAIYSARRNSSVFAIKVERCSKTGSLVQEQKILQSLSGCKYVPKVLDSGKHENKADYMVMPLLGENLSNIRKKHPNQRFSLRTTMQLGMQMLRAIKQGNFVLGHPDSEDSSTVIIIDFGLSKKHLDSDGRPLPQRKSARWVGSRRYMSPNTHLRKDQARRDDLWSLLYCLIEFYSGTLPWAHLRGLNNFDRVKDMKLEYLGKRLVRGLPQVFEAMLNHIKSLRYEDRPDYRLLHNLMLNAYLSDIRPGERALAWEPPAEKLELFVACTTKVLWQKGANSCPIRSATESVKTISEEVSSSDSRSPSGISPRLLNSVDQDNSGNNDIAKANNVDQHNSYPQYGKIAPTVVKQSKYSEALNSSAAPQQNGQVVVRVKRKKRRRCTVM